MQEVSTLIIGVAGFSWSGSGAVMDYLMEFEETQVYTPELILAFHSDGLHDLDVNLNENCAKFLSSGVAIPRFRKVVKYLLQKRTKGKSKKITEEYLNQITQAKWIGSEQGQMLVRSTWLYRHVGQRLKPALGKLPQEFCWKYSPYPLSEMEFSICPDHFLEITQDYVDKILCVLGLDMNKKIVLNQPFPGNNPIPYMKYFRNSKAIVVDRDPRDLFVFLKYVIPGEGYSVPLEKVEAFCEYYHHMHKNLSATLNSPDVLYIHFEDMVYNFEKTASEIDSFLGLHTHVSPRKYFIPEESEANTQVFLKYGKKEETEVIEKRLKQYLYDFSKVEKKNLFNSTFDDNPKSANYSFQKV